MKPFNLVFYRRDGTPYRQPNAALKWGKDFGNFKNKVVKQTTLKNGLWVSTVWIGIDESFWMGKPKIFETKIFESKKSLMQKDFYRYSTEKEAIAGHKQMCQKWKRRKS